MFKNSFHRFFPTPRILSMPSFGLDISDESLKFVSLYNTKDGIRIKKHGDRRIPPGAIGSGKINDPKQLQDILSLLRKSEKIKSVRVSLPEEQIYMYRMRLDKAGLENVREAIELTLEEHIPIPAGEAIFDYEILEEDDKSLRIQVAAIPTGVIENYLSVFKNSNIFVQSFELEAQAISRAVVKRDDLDTYMIVDFGERRTGISIVSRGVVMFTSTLDVGGVMLTNMIQKNFKVSPEEAEEMKKIYGLQRNVANKEIFAVILNIVSILRDEIVKHFLYWHTHSDEEGRNNPQIRKLILCGGDSNLIGLGDYLSVSLKTKVEMANVWINIMDTDHEVPQMNIRQALSYSAALGLALGDFERE